MQEYDEGTQMQQQAYEEEDQSVGSVEFRNFALLFKS